MIYNYTKVSSHVFFLTSSFKVAMTESRYYDMDFSELTKIIFSRIQKAEPDNVIKIMGCIFLKEPGEQEMIQLAFGPEATLLSKIADSKAMLGILSPTSATASSQIQSISDHQYASSFPPGSRSFSSPATFHPYWDPQNSTSDHHSTIQSLDFALGDDYCLHNQGQVLSMDDPLEPNNPIGNYYYQDACLSSRINRRSPSLPEFPIKSCHYFYKGYCKHGANCRYFHGPPFPDGYTSHVFNPNMNELGNDDNGFLPGSLEKLEMEIAELLRSRRGMPVSIASLPMLYYEKYGRNLQADGYLTESQRHGKAGFSLTKLLARLKNSIRLVDR